jgi:DNA end-binding protein Ku
MRLISGFGSVSMSISQARSQRSVVEHASPSASRCSWTGQLALGEVLFSVKAYPAVVPKSNSALHQIHAGCGQRIEYQKTCPVHGTVPTDQIAKSFTLAPNDELVFSAAEFEQLQAEDDHTLRVEHLLPAPHVHLTLLSGRTLFLIPAHAAAEAQYALLVTVLDRSNLWAIGRVVLSGQRQLVAVHVVEHRLLLHLLHWPASQHACPTFCSRLSDVSKEQVRAFEKSLASLRRPFSWDEYVDEYEQAFEQAVCNKLTARSPVLAFPPAPPSKSSSRKRGSVTSSSTRSRAA